MPADAPRCIDCNAPLKAVPSWLANAKVSFTCTSCPKRSHRASPGARFEPAVEPRVAAVAAPVDDDIDADEVEEMEDIDLDADVELDDPKEDDV